MATSASKDMIVLKWRYIEMGNIKTVFGVTFVALILLVGLGCQSAMGPAREPELLELYGHLDGHDPVMIREGDTYYIFTTGGRRGGMVPIRVSKDMYNWTHIGDALSEIPAWVREEVPRARNAWAPDISYFNGKYHLYYSVSSFGVNHSAIGLATNVTLDPNSPGYEWIDQGMVVRSRPDEDDFNAIDGNLVIEDEDNIWLSWGSFWGGIMMRRVNPATGKLCTEDTTLHVLASRPRANEHQTPPVEGAVEAPFIIKHGRYWYLFASYDFCCRGADSTYNIRVGRSRNVTGPYVDRDGKLMTENGGTIVLESTEGAWVGPGHQAIYRDQTGDYLVFHAYNAHGGRGSRLFISTMVWEKGWPRVAEVP